jgi:hypothetical protein
LHRLKHLGLFKKDPTVDSMERKFTGLAPITDSHKGYGEEFSDLLAFEEFLFFLLMWKLGNCRGNFFVNEAAELFNFELNYILRRRE